MAFLPAIRLTVFAPRSVDASETTVLVAGTGSPHSDAFQVISHQGIAGLTGTWQPYLDYPKAGRRGQTDLLKKKNKGGSFTFSLLDRRVPVGGTNLPRWVTGFMGDAQGIPQLTGLRLKAELTEDRTLATPVWTDWWTGRIDDVKLSGLNGIDLVCGDLLQELTGRVLGNYPHSSVSEFIPPALWPLGVFTPSQPFPVAPIMTGTINPSTVLGTAVILDQASTDILQNIVSDQLRATGVPYGLSGLGPEHVVFAAKPVATVKETSGPGIGNITNFRIGAIKVRIKAGNTISNPRWFLSITEIIIDNDGGALPANGTSCEVSIRDEFAQAKKEAPYRFNTIHPAKMIEYAVDGKLGLLNTDGSVRRAFPKKASGANSITAFKADLTLKSMRFNFEDDSELVDLIEDICQQANIGWRQNDAGEFELVDHRMPDTTAGLPTLGNADLILGAGASLSWKLSRKNAITEFQGIYYVDESLGLTDRPADDAPLGFNFPAASLIRPIKREVWAIDFGRADLGQKPHKIDFFGYRTNLNEQINNLPRDTYVLGQVLEAFDHYRSPYGYGPQEMDITWRRSTTSKGIREGDLYFIAVDQLPNPGSNQRGGTRLVRLMSWREVGPTIIHRVLDMGPAGAAATPTVGALALTAGNTEHSVTFTVTVNAAGDRYQVDMAVTATSVATVGAVPDDFWARHFFGSVTRSWTIGAIPAGRRVWIRARSTSGPNSIATLPSAWTYASGADFIDTTALTTPTTLAVTGTTQLGALLTWSLAGGNSPIEVHLVSPSSGTLDDTTLLITLPAGSTRYQIDGTTNGTTYRAGVRAVDGVGGQTAFSNQVTWTASGTPPTAPTPLGLAIIPVP